VQWYDAWAVAHEIAFMRVFHVYVLASRAHVLYVGVTSDLRGRLWRHRNASYGFASKYGATRLVHVEATTSAHAAIAREKQIKGWRRARKIALVERENPRWVDLARGWYE
jgi:putative endonuclease